MYGPDKVSDLAWPMYNPNGLIRDRQKKKLKRETRQVVTNL